MRAVSEQLEILGLDGARRLAESAGASPRERSRLLRRVDVTHELMSSIPAAEDLSFLHSGLCQTCLPHSRPTENHTIWHRQSGRFSLMVQPGVVDSGEKPHHVGVPYGPKARLILIHRKRLVSPAFSDADGCAELSTLKRSVRSSLRRC